MRGFTSTLSTKFTSVNFVLLNYKTKFIPGRYEPEENFDFNYRFAPLQKPFSTERCFSRRQWLLTKHPLEEPSKNCLRSSMKPCFFLTRPFGIPSCIGALGFATLHDRLVRAGPYAKLALRGRSRFGEVLTMRFRGVLLHSAPFAPLSILSAAQAACSAARYSIVTISNFTSDLHLRAASLP